MVVKIVTAESGTTGAQVVQGASVGGDTVDLISTTGSGSITIDATAGRAGAGTKSLRVTTAATADIAILGFNTTDSPKAASVDCYLMVDALPAANMTVLQVRNGAGLATLVLQTNGRLTVSYAGGSGTVLGAGDPAVAPGTLYRLALGVDIGATGTGDGTVNAAIYSGSSTTPIKSFTITTASLGTALLTGARIGKLITGEATTAAMNFDDFRVTTQTAALLPSGSPNVVPTVSAGPDQTNVEPWATVTLTATASDPDGTTPTVSWAQTAGSPAVTLAGTGASRTFEAPGTLAGTTLTFTATASDGSLTASDPMTVTVLPVTERAAIGGVEVPMRVRAN